MKRAIKLLGVMGMGLLASVFMTVSAGAVPIVSPAVEQTTRLLDANSDIINVHRWHCRWRRGHRHPGACEPVYDEPYYEPYYDNGIPNVVIAPRWRPRAGSRCTRRTRNHCIRRWRGQPGRRARCLRKYRC